MNSFKRKVGNFVELLLHIFPRLLILGRINIADLPSQKILGRIDRNTSADSNSSQTQNFSRM